MIVLGLMGKIGSGKDTVADFLVNDKEFTVVGFGDATREVAEERGIEMTRENLLEIQKEHVEKHGIDFWAKKVAEIIKERGLKKAIVNGVRRPTDATTLKKEFGDDFHLILVETDSKIRYERMVRRGRVGDPEEYEAFEKQEKAEIEAFGLDETFEMAEITITNNTTLEDLYEKTEEIISEL